MTEIEFVVSFMPGGWKRPARWSVHHDDCTFEQNSLEEIRETLGEHMKREHDFAEEVEPLFRYQINGIDVTEELNLVHKTRAEAEEADRQHKIARLKFANMMRDQ